MIKIMDVDFNRHMAADESSARVGGKGGDYFEKCLRMEINMVLGTEAL